MEPRFGRDFSRVRVHADTRAADSARAVAARAYTVGSDVVFGPGEYAPATTAGRHLIAHELAHVVQQADGAVHVSGGGLPLQRQQAPADLGTRFYAALRTDDLPLAVRLLGEMSDADARAVLSALQTQTRQSLRNAAMALDPTPGNRVSALIEAVEHAQPQAPAPAPPQRDDVASLSAPDKLLRAWGYARGRIGREAAREMENLFTPQSLAIMAAFIVAYIAAQLTPVGWVADAIALTSLTFAAIFMGRLLFEIVGDLYRFFSAVNATSEAEVQAAGEALARAIARGGVQVVLLLLTRGMRGSRGGGRPYQGPPPSAGAEAVTTGGVVVRVPPEAIPQLPRAQLRGPMPELPGELMPGGVRRPPARPARPPVRPEEPAPARPARPARPPETPRPEPEPRLGEGRLRNAGVVPSPPRPQEPERDDCSDEAMERRIGTRRVVDVVRGSGSGEFFERKRTHPNTPDIERAHVRTLASVLCRGTQLPPVTLRENRSSFYIQDGQHRFVAARLMGREINADRGGPESPLFNWDETSWH